MGSELEVRRKVLHLVLGIILVTLIFYDYVDKFVLGAITVLAFLLFYISARVKIHLIEWCLDKFERLEARKTFPGKGVLFYLIGAELSLIFFTKDVAMAAIMILAIGDSIPNLVGMQFRRIRHPFSDKKYLEGMIVGIIVASLAAHVFVIWYEALIATTIALFLEGIDMKYGIDDNLVVPLSAGAVIWLIRLVF